MPTSRPNIVVIMADQHRADAMGCAGDPTVRTPHLDALAGRGVRFTRVNCQGPLCMPARASFLTERYVRDHGVYTNWAELEAGVPTYLHSMRDAGYHTAMLGKAHLRRDHDESIRHIDDVADHLHGHGFAEVIETGDKFNTQVLNRYTDHLAARGLLDQYRRHIADRSYQGDNESGVNATKRVPMWDATPSPLPLADYIDTWHGDAAVRWIEGRTEAEPFFLFVGFPGPHDPWDAPAEAVAAYADVMPSAPSSTTRPNLDNMGTYGRMVAAMMQLSDSDTMDDVAIEAMRRAYFANVSIIDHAVGRIVDALEARGLLDDTWIVYTGDHGEMGGNHRIMSKCLFYEPSLKVPLIVVPPGGCEPRVTSDIVEQIDIPATVRAIAGAPTVPLSDGRSLLGYVAGEDSGDGDDPRDVSVSENWGFVVFETERYKLVLDEDRREVSQLLDRVSDPTEDVNLAFDPDHAEVVAELMATRVEPFLATPPARPHPSPFA